MPTPIRIDGETISGSRLQLISTSCDDDSDDSVELCLIHPDYAVQLRRRLLHIALFMTLYPLFVWWSRFRLIPADALAFGVALVLLHRVARLIQSETVLLAKHVALQASTRFAFGRTQHRLLLPVDSIHDVVVNEVIENVSGGGSLWDRSISSEL